MARWRRSSGRPSRRTSEPFDSSLPSGGLAFLPGRQFIVYMDFGLLSLAGLLIATVSLVGLIYRQSLFATDPVGIVLQVLAFGLMIWARLVFGRRSFHVSATPTEGGLMTGGPYRYLRHPIYAAALYVTWIGVFSHFSPVNVLLGAGVTLGLGMRMGAEERLLPERYPEYPAYAARTKRVVPFVF